MAIKQGTGQFVLVINSNPEPKGLKRAQVWALLKGSGFYSITIVAWYHTYHQNLTLCIYLQMMPTLAL